jgi:hypothetical protein
MAGCRGDLRDAGSHGACAHDADDDIVPERHVSAP